MSITLSSLVRTLSIRCRDYESGIASGGSATTLVDSNLAETYSDDDVFNGGTIVLNEGAGRMQFVSDCESLPPGDFTSVTVTDNDCKVFRDSTYKQTGKWAYRCQTGADASDQAYALATAGGALTTMFAQASFYTVANYTGAAYIMQVQTAAGAPIASVRLTNGALAIYDHTGAVALTPTTTTLTNDAYHRIELGLVISATVGQVNLWLDDVPIYSGRSLNLGSVDVQKVLVGLIGTTVAQAKIIYVDNVKIDGAYIGTRSAETEKTITNYTGTTGTLEWSGSIVSPAANSTRYSIYDWRKTKWSRYQKQQEINNAIGMLWPEFYCVKTDPTADSGTATIVTVRNTFHYALPSACMKVMNVWIQPSTSTAPYTRLVHWREYGESGARYLYVPDINGYDAGRNIRIEYVARATELENDNDVLQVDAAYERWAQDYIVDQALSQLWLSTDSPAGADLPMSQSWERKALDVKKNHAMPVPFSVVNLPDGDGYQSTEFTSRIAPF